MKRFILHITGIMTAATLVGALFVALVGGVADYRDVRSDADARQFVD